MHRSDFSISSDHLKMPNIQQKLMYLNKLFDTILYKKNMWDS